MGEVYRACDARLKRDVAINILPDEFAGDPERVNRFQCEAETYSMMSPRTPSSFFSRRRKASRWPIPANATPITVVPNWTALLKCK
jgi:serine/threonine protein kinase